MANTLHCANISTTLNSRYQISLHTSLLYSLLRKYLSLVSNTGDTLSKMSPTTKSLPFFSRLRIPQWLRQLVFLIHSRKRRGSVLTLAVMGQDMWTQQGSVISLKRTALRQPRNLITRL